MISIVDLKRYVAAYPEVLPRTLALEKRIKIGTGFHSKWYRSQKEHQLGWLVVQECSVRKKNGNPATVSAKGMWGRLKCSPSMYWYAEAAGATESLLDAAEQAAFRATSENPKDGNPHGKYMREVLPWEIIEKAILSGPQPVSTARANAEAVDAFSRLVDLRKDYRWCINYLS